MHLQQPTSEQFIERGVDARLARILTDPESYHRSLSIMVRAVYRGWDYYIPAGVTEIVPLWDENADCRVRWVRNGQTEHVWLYHDDPHWELIAKSEQGIMAQLWT